MTIWYDFTTSFRNASRNGIANVEWQIGRALLAERDDVRPFAMRGRKLIEVDPEADLGAAFYATADSTPPRPGRQEATTLSDKVRRSLVESLGPTSTPIIKSVAAVNQPRKRAIAAIRDRRDGVVVEQRRAASVLSDVVGADDLVLSLGADWEGRLAKQLGSLRSSTGCRLVTMVYDLIPLTHTHLAFHKEPELFRRYYLGLLEHSDAIFCISRQSERDLVEFAEDENTRCPPTDMLRLGDGHLDRAVDSRDVRGDHFLCVGTIERRKNIELLYDALRILESEGRPLPKILVVGEMGWGVSDFMRELKTTENRASAHLVTIGPLDDRGLDFAYRHARALLFPSYYEGWGLPVREAAVRGCPIIAGDCDAIREATEGVEGVQLLDPDDPAAWADRLTEPVITPSHPADVFSWAQSAHQLIERIAAIAPPRAPDGTHHGSR